MIFALYLYNFVIMRIQATQNTFGKVLLVSILWNDLRSIGANTFLKVIKNSVPNSPESGLLAWNIFDYFFNFSLVEYRSLK